MGCGCNTHLGYSTDGTKHPYEYPAHYGCKTHSTAAIKHDGHGRYAAIESCATHRHVNGCWGHVASIPPLERDAPIALTDFSPEMEGQITAAQHNALVAVISHERHRWHQEQDSVESLAVIPGDILTNERMKALRNSLFSEEVQWTRDIPPDWDLTKLDDELLEDGDMALAEHIAQLQNRVHDLQATCTCNCNYCTCNCNYCTCNCNYSCTCNCNYSY